MDWENIKFRMFIINKNNDAKELNAFLESLEKENIIYDYDYDYRDGYPGIIVNVSF